MTGVTYRPRLVQAVMDRITGQLQQLPAVARGKLNVKPDTLKLIREALAAVVKEGTAGRAKSALVTIGGKDRVRRRPAALRTGPEKDIPKKFRDHAWFVAFAPVESPRLPLPSWPNIWAMAVPRPRPLPKSLSRLI